MATTDRVIVTGAAGFVGSYVAEALEAEGYDVLRTYIGVQEPRKGAWKRADITRPDELIKLTQGAKAVCHIGGIGDVNVASTNPQLALHVNGCGTLNLLEACRLSGVERFAYASSWEVYGQPSYEPIDENHPCQPFHPYSVSKLAGDLLTQSFGQSTPLQTVVLRLATTYGARMRTAGVIPSFILKALRGEPIEIHGTGAQLRQFTHARDVAAAFSLALKHSRPARVYNIVSPEKVSIRQLAELITTRIPGKLTFRESRAGDPPSAVIDSGRAERELGWKPKVTLQEGLEEMEQYLREPGSSLGGNEAAIRVDSDLIPSR